MKHMADANPPALLTARTFPAGVPTLIDAAAGVKLRAAGSRDLAGIVEQCRDPEMIRWTSVPTPDDGYQLRDAAEFLAVIAAGWTSGERLGWTIEAHRDSARGFCGSIDLRLEGDGIAEVGFGLHPQARGRGVMTAALRLVCDYGFEVAGLQIIRWRAVVGNWASRRVAANVGFIFDGTARRLLAHRGELLDGWIATLTREDPRVPQPWLQPVELQGAGIRLRAFRTSDVDRIVEACSDPHTAHWLVSMPRPYQTHNALAYLDSVRELAARGIGITRGRGMASEAVRVVTQHARSTGLVRSLIIRCARSNTASRRVAERAGYTKVGIQPASEPLSDGQLADLVLYSCP
jgi:RimJ/RimL family protein N-acetyltransferase